MKTKEIKIGGVRIGGNNPLVLIAGPCVIESEKTTIKVACKLSEIAEKIGIPLIFKSSYDKANRSSKDSFRGPGLKEGLRILKNVKKETGLPVLSDVHNIDEVKMASEILDILQIPAFLCRQTDLIMAVARTGKTVNIKKGQFLAPWDIKNIIEKVISAGNKNIIITERGVSFGYNNLVADMRALPIMRALGYPVAFDATHSTQLPGGMGKSSGGEREMIPYLARAAVATGCDAIFLEVHECPERALCDGPNMVSIRELPDLLSDIRKIDRIVRGK
ncbi:MAG: 3-deoxy-8-phosphooctulonate synthase [Nitrospirota bacterium]